MRYREKAAFIPFPKATLIRGVALLVPYAKLVSSLDRKMCLGGGLARRLLHPLHELFCSEWRQPNRNYLWNRLTSEASIGAKHPRQANPGPL